MVILIEEEEDERDNNLAMSSIGIMWPCAIIKGNIAK